MAEGDLLKIATIANSGSLNSRIAAAIEQTANYVLAGNGDNPVSENTLAFARRAFQDPLTEANSRWIWIVASDPAVIAQDADLSRVTDQVISTIVAKYWPLLWA